MSDFNSCGFGAISPELVLRSLLSGIQAIDSCGLRTVDVDTSQMTLISPLSCGSAEDLWTLFTRSLVMADDGLVAIRTTTTTSLEGAGLDNCGGCVGAYFWTEIGGAIFVEDENGNVYMNIIKITT